MNKYKRELTKEKITAKLIAELDKLGFVISMDVARKELVGLVYNYYDSEIEHYEAINDLKLKRGLKPISIANEFINNMAHGLVKDKIAPILCENVERDKLAKLATNLEPHQNLYVPPETLFFVNAVQAFKNEFTSRNNVIGVRGITFSGGLLVNSPIKYFIDVKTVEIAEIPKNELTTCGENCCKNDGGFQIRIHLELGVEVPR